MSPLSTRTPASSCRPHWLPSLPEFLISGISGTGFKNSGRCGSPIHAISLPSHRAFFAFPNQSRHSFPPSPIISVINNGFDLAEFTPLEEAERIAARNQFGFAPGDLVVGTVGRIKFLRKGQEFLLQAISLLRKKGIRIKCLLAGGVPPGAADQMEKMKRLSEELGISDDVVFTGEMADPRPAYAAMNIFVLPSAQPEPFGPAGDGGNVPRLAGYWNCDWRHRGAGGRWGNRDTGSACRCRCVGRRHRPTCCRPLFVRSDGRVRHANAFPRGFRWIMVKQIEKIYTDGSH